MYRYSEEEHLLEEAVNCSQFQFFHTINRSKTKKKLVNKRMGSAVSYIIGRIIVFKVINNRIKVILIMIIINLLQVDSTSNRMAKKYRTDLSTPNTLPIP